MGGSDVVSRGTFGMGGQPRKPKIFAMSAQVAIQCDCGSPVPLLLSLIPGADLFVLCPDCQKRWFVDRVEYHGHRGDRLDEGQQRAAEKLSIGLHAEVPRILPVHGTLKQ
jgi:hypothetical protein